MPVRTHEPIIRISLSLIPLGKLVRSSIILEKFAGSRFGKGRDRFANRLDNTKSGTKRYVKSSVDFGTLQQRDVH